VDKPFDGISVARKSVLGNDIILLNSGLESRLGNLTSAIPLLRDFSPTENSPQSGSLSNDFPKPLPFIHLPEGRLHLHH
jgi:hypothetical protein